MIKSKYKTLTITYDNHTNLENTQTDSIIKELEDNLDNLLNRLNKKVITEPHYCSVRIESTNFLIIYINPNLKNNPYLFLYNTKTKEYSFTISYNLFLRLKNKYIMYDFEDKIKNIDKKLNISYEMSNMLIDLEKIANLYDLEK